MGNLTITANDIYTNGNKLTFWGTKTRTVNNGGGSGISQGGKVVLGSSITSTAILAANNSYTGNTAINSGTLKVGNSSGLGANLLTARFGKPNSGRSVRYQSPLRRRNRQDQLG